MKNFMPITVCHKSTFPYRFLGCPIFMQKRPTNLEFRPATLLFEISNILAAKTVFPYLNLSNS